jgi:hypothetical protein
MTPFPWEEFRAVIAAMAGCADDYVTVSGAGESIVQPTAYGAALTWLVRINPRRAQGVGQGRADHTTTTETLGGKVYRVVTQSGHDAYRMDIVVESFDKETYAGDVSRELARAFEDEGIHARLSELDLSVASVGDSVDVTFVREGQELSASALEVLVYHKWTRVDRTARELIETIEVNRT